MSSMHLQLSKFNHIVQRPDGHVAYNAATGTFLRLDPELLAILTSQCAISNASADHVAALQENGFVVSFDEIKNIADKVIHARQTVRAFYSHFVISPTLRCNFRCSYCDQNNLRGSQEMSTSTAARVAWTIANLPAPPDSTTRITWYGGEPTLCLSGIEMMISHHLALDKVQRNFDHTIITNGTLLDSATISTLLDLGVKKAQITIDSYKYIKGQKRGVAMPNGQPSPIVINALAAIAAGMQVSLRINVDTSVCASISEIDAFLHKIGLDKSAYISRVEENNEIRNNHAQTQGHACGPLLSASNAPPRRQYAELEKTRLFDKRHVSQLLGMLTPKTDVCGATKASMLVFAPDGGVSRCWNSVGTSNEELGNVHDTDIIDKISSDVSKSVWADYLPTKYESCRTCKALPLCMGGCSHGRVMLSHGDPPCTPIKYYLEDLINYVGERLDL